MADLLTQSPKFGDTDNTLLLKIAQILYDNLSDTTGFYRPEFGESNNALLLKIAQYLEAL